MLVSAGSPDSIAAIRSSSPTRHRSKTQSYGAGTLLNFFFHRVTRSGPKLLLYLALLLASSLLITKCLPTAISESIVSSTSHLWKFRPGLGFVGSSSGRVILPPGENNDYDALAGGGLRIVVFGENDIATSMLQNVPGNVVLGTNNGTTWTRELCIELGCTTYLSYVPPLDQPRRSLISNPLYGAVTDDILKDAKGATPANDYTYVKTAYPITWEAPDLTAQVSRFINTPAPPRAPKESVYVFSFGMWDVWSLAAFPYSRAEHIITAMVSDIFSNVETLYDAAHNNNSIAFSNYSMTPLDESAINATNITSAHNMAPRDTGSSKLFWDDASSEPFRVVVPLLFDPSLVPGWHLDRPDAPEVHTKPEQLRNAVLLTKRWNDFVISEMDLWEKKGVDFVRPEDRPKLNADDKKAQKKKKGNSASTPPNLSSKKRRDETAAAAAAATTAAATATATATPNHGSPSLNRDGIIFRMPDYLMDVIIDGQLHQRGISDRKGFGKLSNAESFSEVDKPCLAPVAVGLSNSKTKITTEMHMPGIDNKKEGGDKAGEKTDDKAKTGGDDALKAKAQEAAQQDPKTTRRRANTILALEVCERPERYLFFTPFSLGQRAIEEVGRISAAVLRANRSTRVAWEKTSRDTVESNRLPASWKEYFVPS